jgi:hypothetical protein
MKTIFNLIPAAILMFALGSCEKVIDIEVPDSASSIVIEGSIESGGFPFILISRSESYFAPISTSIEALANVMVPGDSAQVFITVDGVETEVSPICLADLSPEQQELAEDLLGFDEIPDGLDICAWVDPLMIGVEGKTYGLRVVVDGQEYTATTTIPNKVYLDSLWFKVQPSEEGLGFIWTTLDDPDTAGNSYRLYAERIGVDDGPIPVPGASFDDRFFNGEAFDYNFARGTRFGVEEDEDSAFYFATGDLVAIKHATTDLGVYEFWETADDAIAGGGNPFSTPIQVKSNISNGARGVWAGYGVTWDTLECIPVQ